MSDGTATPAAGAAETGSFLVGVCVCTYKRPVQLRRLLDSLAGMVRPDRTLFIVVDNDGSDPQVEACVSQIQRSRTINIQYVLERAPGIAAARNTALATARGAGAQLVAMLDDDELATQGWLSNLLETHAASGAGIVGGPVQPVFGASPPEISGYEWLWSIRKGFRGGRVFVSCTCNCLIDLSAVRFLGENPFPAEFGLTGGEDAVFFRRLHNAGVKMAWAENAVLYEDIPAERARFVWMRQRWYRQGNVGVACERIVRARGELSVWLRTVLLLARLPFYPLFRPETLGSPRIWFLEAARLRGRLAAHMGVVYKEYDRTTFEKAAPG